MSEERLEIIKENAYIRSEIAKNSRIGIDTSLKEELELIEEINRLINLNKQLVEECQRLDDEETRLNNIIDELEKYINKLMGQTRTAIAFNKGINDIYETKKYERDNVLFEMILDKLKELKENK